MQIKITKYYPDDLNSLVSDCPWGSFYHTTYNVEILKAVTPAQIQFITCYHNYEPVGGIAYAVQTGFLGNVVNCLPYFGSYGDALVTGDAPRGTEESVYAKLIKQCSGIDALCLNVITSPFADTLHHEKVKECLSPTFIDKRSCQISCLPEYRGENRENYSEKILSMLQGRARTAYRKIQKSDFEYRRCSTEQEALQFAQIHKANIEAKGGQFKSAEFFLKTFEMSQAKPDNVELAAMFDRGKLIAGIVLFRFNDTVEYHTTCLLDEYRSIGPLNRIIVEKMIDAGMSGYRFWNFGGTWKTQEGVYLFKKSFGAGDRNYYYYTVFFRDVERIKKMSPKEILKGYPFCYVIPFSEFET